MSPPEPKHEPTVMQVRGSDSRKNRRADKALKKRAKRWTTRAIQSGRARPNDKGEK